MQDNQNAFQNAGSHGFSYYVSIGNRTSTNQTSTWLALILAFAMLVAFFVSEERYRKLVERLYLETHSLKLPNRSTNVEIE